MCSVSTKKRPPKKSSRALSVKAKSIADELSIEWLQKNARPKAFQRAKSYVHDDVIEILHWSDREIIAEMYGSQPYTVSLRINKSTIHADCTCPARHDWPGFCKHIVGLGLYVMECRDQSDGFPRLKETISAALKKLPANKLYRLCLDLAFLNRNFRDRILNDLGISFETKNHWEDYD